MQRVVTAPVLGELSIAGAAASFLIACRIWSRCSHGKPLRSCGAAGTAAPFGTALGTGPCGTGFPSVTLLPPPCVTQQSSTFPSRHHRFFYLYSRPFKWHKPELLFTGETLLCCTSKSSCTWWKLGGEVTWLNPTGTCSTG